LIIENYNIMNKVIEFVNRHLLINVINVNNISLIDNKIIFHMNNSFSITIEDKNANKLYKRIKEFMLDNEANIMQIE